MSHITRGAGGLARNRDAIDNYLAAVKSLAVIHGYTVEQRLLLSLVPHARPELFVLVPAQNTDPSGQPPAPLDTAEDSSGWMC